MIGRAEDHDVHAPSASIRSRSAVLIADDLPEDERIARIARALAILLSVPLPDDD
jgi:hypothetical protein